MRENVLQYFNTKFFYGWIIVGVANLGIFSSGPGQSHTFSVFVGPISKDLGLSNASIASAYGLATLIAAFLLPYMGKIIDKYGFVLNKNDYLSITKGLKKSINILENKKKNWKFLKKNVRSQIKKKFSIEKMANSYSKNWIS